MNIPDGFDDYVNDYKINLYQIAYLSDDQIQKFKSDFRIVAEFFSQKQKHKDFITESSADKTRERSFCSYLVL